jgi:hypothetical protein
MWFVVLLCLGVSVALGAPPAIAEGGPKAVVSEAQVSTWVRLWQRRLHLEDWKVDACVVHASGLKPGTLGNLKWNSISHTATIKVLNPADYDMPAVDAAEDIEYTVVHELVHLQLSALPRDLNRKDIEEQVVNKISDALMQFEHGSSFRARSQPVVPYRPKPGDSPPVPGVAGRQTAPPTGK